MSRLSLKDVEGFFFFLPSIVRRAKDLVWKEGRERERKGEEATCSEGSRHGIKKKKFQYIEHFY